MSRVSIVDLQRMKAEKEKIVVMTAYDYTLARIVDRAGVDVILVGDSGGRYALGHDDSNEVTVDEMVIMARAAARGSERAMVVGDMPFMSYQVNDEQAVVNAGRLIQEAGVQSVKLEVGAEYASTVAAIVKAGIPVMAHMGSTPMANIGAGDFRSGSVDEEQVWRDAQGAGQRGVVLVAAHRHQRGPGAAHHRRSAGPHHRGLRRRRPLRRPDRRDPSYHRPCRR